VWITKEACKGLKPLPPANFESQDWVWSRRNQALAQNINSAELALSCVLALVRDGHLFCLRPTLRTRLLAFRENVGA
jgi:hypothetical protein